MILAAPVLSLLLTSASVLGVSDRFAPFTASFEPDPETWGLIGLEPDAPTMPTTQARPKHLNYGPKRVFGGQVPSQTVRVGRPEEPLPARITLYNHFYTNLHHFLYEQATKDSAPTSPIRASPDSIGAGLARQREPGQQEGGLTAAVAYYRKNLTPPQRGELSFDSELIEIGLKISRSENIADLRERGLEEGLIQALVEATPVYRERYWPEDERRNQTWMESAKKLVMEKGEELAKKLTIVYQSPWPKEPIRMDVTGYAGPAGVYTSPATAGPAHTVISSADPRNQGLDAAEVIFHEASHALIKPVLDAISSECRSRNRPIPRDLWHALLFYTTGQLVQRELGGHLSYAERYGLYQGRWARYLEVLRLYWQPYLDGRTDFDQAIASIIAAL